VRSRLPLCNSKDLSVLAWSLGRLGYVPDGGWLADYAAAWQRALPRAAPSDVVSCLRFFARARLQPDGAFLFDMYRVTQGSLGAYTARELSGLAWALSYLRLWAPAQWVDALLPAAAAAAPSASADDITIVLFALPTLLRRLPSGWAARQRPALATLCAALLPQLPAMEPRSLLRCIEGLAYARHHPGSTFLLAHQAAMDAAVDALSQPQRRRVSAAYAAMAGGRAPAEEAEGSEWAEGEDEGGGEEEEETEPEEQQRRPPARQR